MIDLSDTYGSYGVTMSVGELIEKLQSVDPNLPVLTEGCDCDGSAFSVTVEDFYSKREPLPIGSPFYQKEEPSKKYVYIRRSE